MLDKSELKKFVDAGYQNKREANEINGYVLDKELSTRRDKIYVHPTTGKVKHVIAGTDSAKDWSNNILIPLGLHHLTNRYKNSERIHKLANEKYGKENVDLITHSQSGNIADNLAKRGLVGGENTTLNPAILGKHSSNLQVVKSAFDPVSLLTETNKNDVVLNPSSINPLTEHSSNILGSGLKSKIQSILFNRPEWKLSKAKSWLKNHGFKTSVDSKPEHYRFRQLEPELFNSYITKHVGEGITLIIGSNKDIKKKGGNIGNMKKNLNHLREQDLIDRMAKLSHDMHLHHKTHGMRPALLQGYKIMGEGLKHSASLQGKGLFAGDSDSFSQWMKKSGEAFKKIQPYAEGLWEEIKNYGKGEDKVHQEYLEKQKEQAEKNQQVIKKAEPISAPEELARKTEESKKPKKTKKPKKSKKQREEEEEYNEDYEIPIATPVEEEDTFNSRYRPAVKQPVTIAHEIDHYNVPEQRSFNNEPSSYNRSWQAQYGRGIHGEGFFDDLGNQLRGGFSQFGDNMKSVVDVVANDAKRNNVVDILKTVPDKYSEAFMTGINEGKKAVMGQGIFDDMGNLLKNKGTTYGKKLAKLLNNEGIPYAAGKAGESAGEYFGLPPPLARIAGTYAGKRIARHINRNTELGGYGLKDLKNQDLKRKCYLVKGSPEAKEWAAKMRLARSKGKGF